MSHNANMIPKISVTSYHSTSTKYNNILEDNISYLQNIRESIQIGPPSSATATGHHSLLARKSNNGSSIIFGSAIPICLSLPDLSGPQAPGSNAQPLATAGWYNGGFGGAARRKSWAAVEERHFDRVVNKCDSASSLDSQSRADTSHAHNKRRSNSTAGAIVDGSGTGGANSTHSLNDAKFFFEFDGQPHKLNELSMIHCRLPLQKSISTPSIPPACEHAKEDTAVAVARHFSDTDEENQDERSLLCVKEKTSEVDHPEKRRKRGSLFFRKKKDKSKTKATTPKHCDDCSNASGSCAEHTYDVKSCMKPIQITKSSSKKSSDNSHHQPRPGESLKDLTDGPMAHHHHHHGDHVNFPDNAALLHYEFLNEAHLMAHHLDDDAVLGIGRETEHDTWSPRVGTDIVKQLTAKQIKRQEHIYELIITEKRHCQILCLMQKVFVESLQQHFGALKIDGLFPRLPDLMRLHKGFLKQLRLKQDTHPIVDSIADILLEFFSGESAQQLKSAYGEFCSNHQTAVDKFKCFQNTDVRFAMWHNHKQTNPLLKRKGIPECMLFVVQRLTKYPILIEDQLKLCKENGPEREKLLRANAQIKDILVDVNAQVALMDNNNRLVKIYALIDFRSTTTFGGEKFSKSSIKLFNHKLKFEGVATLMQGRTKEQTVNVIVLSDCLFFLQKKEKEKEKEKEKLQFFTPEGKAGVVSLQKLLIRENATDSRGIYLISSLSTMPEMYELKVQQPKDKNVWIQAIRAAVSSCPLNMGGAPGGQTANGAAMTEEQQQDECRDAARRELIAKMRMNDLEHAILLDQKIAMQANYLRELGIALPAADHASGNAETYLAQFGSYRQLLGRDEAAINCDTVDLTRRAVNTVQEIGTLIGTLYRTATGVELPLRVASLNVGEASGGGRKAGGSAASGGGGGAEFVTYKHPSRAETFSGYDEKMSKLISPWRDAVVSSLANSISSNISSSGHNSHHESTTSVASSASTPATMGTASSGDSPQRSSATSISTGGAAAAAADGTASPLSQTASANNVSATASSLDTVTMRHVATSGRATVPATAQDHHNALLVAHHLHALLAVAHQLLSTVAALQHELRDHPKSLYRHDVQLEELRNLQDKFQEEKTVWMRQREAQEAELAERLAEERVQQQRRHEEQEDLREQREQLYRKLEKLERLEAAAAVSAAAVMPPVGVDLTAHGVAGSGGVGELGGTGIVDGIATHAQLQQYHQQHVEAFGAVGTERRSNNSQRMSSHSKSGPIFSSVPKTGPHANVKQTLPLKLSSSKSDKAKSHSAFSPTTPSAAQSITQLLPLKLADRKGNPATPLSSGTTTSNHTRTGSSPAIVQQHAPSPGITSPTLTTAAHSYVPVAASRYEDRSRASRRSDTALIPMRLASMSSVSSSAASTPTGRPASAQYAAATAGAAPVAGSNMRHLQSRTPSTVGSAAATPAAGNPQQPMQNQQEEIYF